MEASPKRLHLKSFIPATTCKELEFIHKSCGVAGYRPFVVSTTLLHLIATNCSSLIMPFIPIREKVKELVEELYGCEYQLFVEFTGLISWLKGARIGWHNDNGRTYLKQRHFTAVCYLNSHAVDFHGGLFHFQEGVQTTIVPQMGDVLIYRAEDMHSVDEVTYGERCTLAVWLTLDSSWDEDAKILNCINVSRMRSPLQGVCSSNEDDCWSASKAMWIPLPASASMYIIKFADEIKQHKRKRKETVQFRSDLRVARSEALGYKFCVAVNGSYVPLEEVYSQPNAERELLEDALERLVKLKLDEQVEPYVFANSIHALQVIYFCKWKGSKQDIAEIRAAIVEANEAGGSSDKCIPNTHVKDFSGEGSSLVTIRKDVSENSLQVTDWEQYMVGYHNELQRCLPIWEHFKCLSIDVS